MPLTKFESLKRTPYYAVCADTGGDVTDSKFSGIPWLSEDESWPKCKNCNNEMQLFLQLNLGTLPEATAIKGAGLLQLFYCTNKAPHCEVDCGSWFWNDKAMLARIVVPGSNSTTYEKSPVAGAFPAKVIRRWEPGETELPRVEELVGYVQIPEAELDDLYEAEGNEVYPGPEGGDKLGGWPCWVQSVEYPECRECKQPMKLVFQIDSQVNVPYMWGDSGCAHVTQCAEHPEVISFGWACM